MGPIPLLLVMAIFLAAGACTATNRVADEDRSEEFPIQLLLNDPLSRTGPEESCDDAICQKLLELIVGAQETVDFAVYGMRDQGELASALEAAQERGVVVRGVVDRDGSGHNIYSSTDDWVAAIGTIRDDLRSKEQPLDDANTGLPPPPCPRPEGFEGPLQCLAYDLGPSWLVAAHASREDFTRSEDGESGPNQIMHDKFFVVCQRGPQPRAYSR